MEKIHLIARAYITDKDHILIADVGAHLFLPEGHVKFNKPIKKALLRDLMEEMGIINVKIESFVGLVENIWNSKNKLIHENSIIFKVSSNELNRNIILREDHLKFHWFTLNELENLNFLPQGLFSFLKQYQENSKPNFLSLIK